MRKSISSMFAALGLLSQVSPAAADDVADFYKGRQLNVIVGYGPGGGYDAYTRALSLHMGRFIPGNPQLVVQYMPGAGSLRAANFIANVAPKDGTTLGVFSVTTALEPLFANPAAQFETARFNWIGNMFSDEAACGTWKNSGLGNFQDVIAAKSEIAFGATGPGSAGNQQAVVLKHLLGANLKVVQGYKGIKDVGLALERGELQAACALSVAVVKSTFDSDYRAGNLKLLVQLGKNKAPYFGDTMHFYSASLTSEQRGIADLIFGQSDVSRPLIGPPDMPPAIVAALRKAMTDTMADPAFLAQAAKMNVEVTPMSGEDTARRVAEFLATPPEIVKQAKQLMGN